MDGQHIKALFIDVGGVILSNGWDRKMRTEAVKKFGLDETETSERHHLTFDTYEEGKISLDEYLDRVVFYEKRNFTKESFKDFMYDSTVAIPDMMALIKSLKEKYGFRIAAVNNEGRELNVHRIQKFRLNEFVDFFVSSSFVHIRKPDADIFRLALDIAQVKAEEIIYIDDREMFVQVAEKQGLRGIWHRNLEDTKQLLAEYGLK